MSKLSHIVDSLNLKFKSCEPKAFHAIPHGLAKFVTVHTNLREAKKAMQGGLSIHEFVSNFPDAKVSSTNWIYGYSYEDRKGNKLTRFQSFPGRDRESGSVEVSGGKTLIPNKWIYDEYNNELSAYFIEEILTPVLPDEYARLVQYVDCMIDTTAQIYLTTADYDYGLEKISPDSHVGKFLAMANNHKGKPKEPRIDWDAPGAEEKSSRYAVALEEWNKAQLTALDQKMKWVPNQNLLENAVEEAFAEKIGSAELEFYVARYLSAAEALQMKRLRRPVGVCSQDRTPRTHAAEICKLAASTAKWDIFLRAHLDIMNDNFSRMSDGSYAWAGRGTYLKELEELDIDAVDLLIGTALRATNVSENHYFADIGRVGRALSETKNPD